MHVGKRGQGCLKSPISTHVVKQLAQATTNKTSKHRVTGPLWDESTSHMVYSQVRSHVMARGILYEYGDALLTDNTYITT